jgi:hypothetical protein
VHLFNVYSIDTKVINIDKSYNLVKRTESPVSLSEADRILSELQSQGHVVELRRMVSEEFREWTKGYV